jgi:hypothetical protein
MIIDTDAIRRAVAAESSERTRAIDKRNPADRLDGETGPAYDARQNRAIRQLTRIEEEEGDIGDVLDRAEQLAQEYTADETPTVKACRELYQDLNAHAMAAEGLRCHWLDTGAAAKVHEIAAAANSAAAIAHDEARRVAEWSGRLRAVLDALTGPEPAQE